MLSVNVSAKNKLEIGDTPPSYLGKESGGDRINLTDHEGKVVVISFWASWCAPCLKELPILENIQNQVGIDKLKVVAVNFKENRKQYRKISRALASLKLSLTHDKRGSIGKSYGVEAVPDLFIVGKDGRLAFHHVGYGDNTIDKIVTVLNEQLAL